MRGGKCRCYAGVCGTLQAVLKALVRINCKERYGLPILGDIGVRTRFAQATNRRQMLMSGKVGDQA